VKLYLEEYFAAELLKRDLGKALDRIHFGEPNMKKYIGEYEEVFDKEGKVYTVIPCGPNYVTVLDYESKPVGTFKNTKILKDTHFVAKKSEVFKEGQYYATKVQGKIRKFVDGQLYHATEKPYSPADHHISRWKPISYVPIEALVPSDLTLSECFKERQVINYRGEPCMLAHKGVTCQFLIISLRTYRHLATVGDVTLADLNAKLSSTEWTSHE